MPSFSFHTKASWPEGVANVPTTTKPFCHDDFEPIVFDARPHVHFQWHAACLGAVVERVFQKRLDQHRTHEQRPALRTRQGRRAGSRNSMSMRLVTAKPVTTRRPIAPHGSGPSGRSATENPLTVAPTASQNSP